MACCLRPLPPTSLPALPCCSGAEVALWKPRLLAETTSGCTFVAHPIAPFQPPPPPPPPPYIPFDASSTYREDFGPKPLPAYEPLPPPPPLPYIPWEGDSTSRTTYVAHPQQRRRPSVALALGGKAAHVVLPSCVPLPAEAEVELTTTHKGQERMELAVLEGDAPAAADNRLLGTCSISGLPRGARPGDVRLTVRLRLAADGRLTVEARCAEAAQQQQAWVLQASGEPPCS